MYDYTSPHDDDLSFRNGQIITVTDQEDDDWYFGEYMDEGGSKQSGLFPRNFVERYEPTTPPRPSRPSRPKKEAEPVELDATPYPPPASHQTTEDLSAATDIKELMGQGAEVHDEEPVTETSQPSKSIPPPTPAREPEPQAPPPIQTTTKPQVNKDPPVAAEKATGSFRDRIAAFNKSAAPPIAPIKPGSLGGSSFIKKPFVPPPPSRNAYVPPPRETPPQKIYRREEDPDLAARSPPEQEETKVPSQQIEGDEDRPKPTSLKERIALLQKQQLEQANRHTEAAQKKERPKRPPKKRTDQSAETENQEALPTTEKTFVETEDDEAQPAVRPPKKRSKSKDQTPLASPSIAPRELLSDTNDADQSAGADTEDGGDTSQSMELPKHPPTLPSRDDSTPGTRLEEAGGMEDEEDEDEEMDPEVKRRMEIRERMAKMSGGMGMAGMFGPPGGLPMGPKKSKTGHSAKKKDENSTEPADQPTAQIMALPGMSSQGFRQVRSPEETDNPMESSQDIGRSPVSPQPRDDEDEPARPERDTGGSTLPSVGGRRSEDKSRPPPIPQGEYNAPA